MKHGRLGILCVLVGIVLQFTACKKDDGTSNGRPVSRSQSVEKGSNEDVSPTGKSNTADRDRVVDRLKQLRQESTGKYLSPKFQNETAQLGIEVNQFRDAVKQRFFFPEIMGSGVGWVDFDLDGFFDLYVGNGDNLEGPSSHSDLLFRNVSGRRFENVTKPGNVYGQGFAQGIGVADLNRDGFDDILVSGFEQTFWLVNLGDGSFYRKEIEAGQSSAGWGTSCVPVDLDWDGNLDLFVARYVKWRPETHRDCKYNETVGYCGPGTFEGTTDHVYWNTGDGEFHLLPASAGFGFPSKALAVCAADFDGDRRPEIYVGSDLTRNALYRRIRIDAKGSSGHAAIQYEDIADDAGVANSKNGIAQATMGLVAKDFDNNGLTDLFLTHYYRDHNTVYLNRGELLFNDASYESRMRALTLTTIGFGATAIDYDNDADFDLFVSNGHVLGSHVPPFEFTPQFFNNDNCRFHDISSAAGEYFQKKWAGRSVAKCDFDNDGDADIVVGHIDRPLALLVNRTECKNRYIGIQLLDLNRRDLTGASVVIRFDKREVVVPIARGESYLAAEDPRLLVGTGMSEKVDVIIKWPDGQDSFFEGVETNSLWLMTSTNERFPVK